MNSPATYPWGDGRRYNSYSRHFRELFGTRLQKVAVDAGFTCPNRDGTVGTGGCTFCNNAAFTPSYCAAALSVGEQIETGIAFHARRYRKAGGYLVYFQSFSNTHKPLAELRVIYDEAAAHPDVRGIVVGTRPDCVDAAKLDYFATLAARSGRHIVLEYGIESVYDDTLRAINRGHDFAAAERAVAMTAERGLPCGAHFIVGLPGETDEMIRASATAINALPLDSVKFHQLQIHRGTAMAASFAADPSRYRFFGLSAYLDLMADLLERLRPTLIVERFAGEAPPRFLAEGSGNTWHGVRNERFVQLLEQRLEARDAWQGRLVPQGY